MELDLVQVLYSTLKAYSVAIQYTPNDQNMHAAITETKSLYDAGFVMLTLVFRIQNLVRFGSAENPPPQHTRRRSLRKTRWRHGNLVQRAITRTCCGVWPPASSRSASWSRDSVSLGAGRTYGDVTARHTGVTNRAAEAARTTRSASAGAMLLPPIAMVTHASQSKGRLNLTRLI